MSFEFYDKIHSMTESELRKSLLILLKSKADKADCGKCKYSLVCDHKSTCCMMHHLDDLDASVIRGMDEYID